MLGSAGAIAPALVMLATGWYVADPLLSAFIGLLILRGAWRLLRESVDVLLESAPAGVDTDRIRHEMEETSGVADVHDLHVWTVSSSLVALSAHVEVTSERDWHDILEDLAGRLRETFGIAHVTLQPEEPQRLLAAFRGCSFDTPEGRQACALPADRAASPHSPETPG